jgi:hypothetical protein
MLGAAAFDPPWSTTMAWSDGVHDLPGRSAEEINRIVRDALLELLDDGLIFFFRAKDFNDEFAQRDERDGLPRDDVLAALEQGFRRERGGALSGEWLSFRATKRGSDEAELRRRSD